MLQPADRSARSYLLSPVSLVPNGRAHLGHIGGPLLKIDVLARHLRRRGDRVVVASTSDVYESHMLVKAYQEGRPVAELCAENFARIAADLAALDIVYDEYVNPLDPRWSARYAAHNLQTMEDLVGNGATEIVRERIPFAPDGRPVVGGWFVGTCPDCGAGAGSYFCEKCGAHFMPQEMGRPGARFPEDEPLEWRDVPCLYLKLRDVEGLFAHMARMGVRADFQAIARAYLERRGPRIRLTTPGDWGIPWPVPGSATPQTIFTYSALLYAANLICGDIAAERLGLDVNAFDPAAGVTTVTCFGIDNAVPFLVGVLGSAIEQRRYKPFDHFLVNYFYDLEHSKFSTNRGHVIWAADIVGKTPASSDAVRFYLASVNPEFETSNFDVAGFVAFTNWMAAELAPALAASQATRPGGPPPPPAPALLARLEELLAVQERALDPATFGLSASAGAARDWIAARPALAREPADHGWWLKGAALLFGPLMPRLAAALWESCGHAGEPRLAEFLERRAPAAQPLPLPVAVPIAVEDLRPCFPATLAATAVG